MANNNTNGTSCGEEGATNAASGDFWIGVVASLLGSVILNLGLNIQKLAFVRNARVPPKERKPVYKNWLWCLGFLVFAIGNGGDAVGLTFTAQSVITPIGAIALVSNLFFARLLIGEQIGCKTTFAIVSIIAGVIMIVVSGNTNCSSVKIHDLKLKFVKPSFFSFAIVHMGTLIALLVYVCRKENKMLAYVLPDGAIVATPDEKDNMGNKDHSKKSQVNVGLLYFTESEKNHLRLAYPLLASCFAAWTVLLSKCVGELVKESARSGESEFLNVETWFLCAGFVCSLPCQIMYINKGLAHFESLYIIPIFYSTWLIGSILMGALFWDEFAGFMVWQFVVFAFGVLFVMLGVVLLQQREILLDVVDDGNEIQTSDNEETRGRNSCGSNGSNGSSSNDQMEGGHGRGNSDGHAARAAVGDVLERRNTFFTRAAASVVKMPATKKPVPLGTVTEQRSRNNSTSSTASSKSDKSNGGTRQPAHVNVNVKNQTVETVEMVEF